VIKRRGTSDNGVRRTADGAGKPRLTPLAHRSAMTEALEIAALPAAPDLAAVVAAWLGRLAGERRLSANTIEAYGRDARQFLAFLAERLGAPASVGEFSAFAPADLRAFLAARRAEGIDPRSLQRALSALRSLARQVVRDGGLGARRRARAQGGQATAATVERA
jgi:hypothetical protein